jgi:hypothetical protein
VQKLSERFGDPSELDRRGLGKTPDSTTPRGLWACGKTCEKTPQATVCGHQAGVLMSEEQAKCESNRLIQRQLSVAEGLLGEPSGQPAAGLRRQRFLHNSAAGCAGSAAKLQLSFRRTTT